MTVARTFGKLGKRAIFDFLFIRKSKGFYSDYCLTLSVSNKTGMGVSILLPFFLAEISLLPRLVCTTQYYQDFDGEV